VIFGSRQRVRLGRAALLTLVVLLLAVACSPAHRRRDPASRFGAGEPAPLPATTPYIVMTGRSAGWAVWPSGSAWLVLQTQDGFAHVTNRTPVAVETDGGLVGSFAVDRAVVAVGAHNRLLSSPLLTWTGAVNWVPAELPDPVADARAAVSLGGRSETAVTAGGIVLTRTATGWSAVADVRQLAPAGGVRFDSIVWGTASLGWLTAHGRAGQPMAFQTSNGGAAWTPVPLATGSVVAALAPCGAGASWLLPVIDTAGTERVLRTGDGGLTWTAGAPLSVAAGEPAWGCLGEEIWTAAHVGSADRVLASNDAGNQWVDRGPAPAGLTDLTPTGDGVGFAASMGKGATLWAVSADGASFKAVGLPAWVAAVGSQTSGD